MGLIIFLIFLTSHCTTTYSPHQILRITTDPSGNYYILIKTKSDKYELHKLNKDFHLLWVYDKNGRGTGDIYYGGDLTVDNKGNAYIKNDIIGKHGGFEEEQIIKISSEGKFLGYVLRHRYTENEQKNMLLHHAFWGLNINRDRLYFASMKDGYHIWSVSVNESEIIGNKTHPKSLKKYLKGDKKNIFGKIVISENGNIYIPDITNNQIVSINPDTNTLKRFGKLGKDLGEFNDPYYMTLDNENRLIVGDMGNRRLQILNDELNPTSQINLKKKNRDFFIDSIMISKDQQIVILESLTSTLHYYNTKGQYIKTVKSFYRIEYYKPVIIVLLIIFFVLIYISRKWILKQIRQIRFTFFKKQIAIFVPAIILTALLTGYTLYTTMISVYEDEVENKLLGIASSVVPSLPVKDFDKLDYNSKITTPEYESIHKTISDLLYTKGIESKDKLEFRWHKIIDNNIYYGVDRYRFGIYSPLFVREKKYFDVLKERKPKVFVYEDMNVHRDFLVALIPIQNKDGHFSVFALQQDAVIFKELKDKISYHILKILSALILISIIILLIFSYLTTVPLKRLINRLSNVTKGIFEPVITGKRSDEIADVASAYNYMIDKLDCSEKEISRLNVGYHDSIKNKLESARNYIDLYINSIENNDEMSINKLNQVSNLLFHCSIEGKNTIFASKNRECSIDKLYKEVEYRAYNSLSVLTNIPYSIEKNILDGNIVIKADVIVYLLDTIDELLNNILKHSKATIVEVFLSSDQEKLVLSVRDNGIGFDPSKMTRRDDSYGLDMIEKRTEEVHAILNIQSSPKEGTYIKIELDIV